MKILRLIDFPPVKPCTLTTLPFCNAPTSIPSLFLTSLDFRQTQSAHKFYCRLTFVIASLMIQVFGMKESNAFRGHLTPLPLTLLFSLTLTVPTVTQLLNYGFDFDWFLQENDGTRKSGHSEPDHIL